MIVAVEGSEAVGKTTFSKALVESLKNSGYKAFYTADPAHTSISWEVRRFICYNEMPNISTLMLVSAARSHHYHTEIKPRHEDGHIVVTDRYVLTSFVYHAETCGRDNVRDLHDMGCESVYPFFNFVIDIPVEESIERLSDRKNKTIFDDADIKTLAKWRYGFLESGKFLPQGYRDPIILDGMLPTTELVQTQKEFIEGYCTERNKK